MERNKSQKIAIYGMLVALALVLAYVEAQIPVFLAVPGMKLGLTNVTVLFALYLMDAKSAMLINFVRILLTSFLFGTVMSLAYSLVGGLLSAAAMIGLKQTGKFHITAVSVAGGIAHNIGQILVAMAVLGTSSLVWYLLILWFTGMGSGAVVGLIGGALCKRLRRVFA